jgi:hypothetical protein
MCRRLVQDVSRACKCSGVRMALRVGEENKVEERVWPGRERKSWPEKRVTGEYRDSMRLRIDDGKV